MSDTTFTIDGTNVGTTYGIYLQSKQKFHAMPPFAAQTAELVGVDGAYLYTNQNVGNYKKYTLNLDCVLTDCTSRADNDTKLAGLVALLDPRYGVHKLIFTHKTSQYWNVVYDGDLPIASEVYNHAFFTLPLLAADPFAWAVTATTTTHTLTNDPEIVTETTSGNYEIEPIYDLRSTAGVSAGETIELRNHTTNMAIQWTVPVGGLAAGELLQIIVEGRQCLVKKGGVISMAGVVTASYFPKLLGNAVNYIQVSGLGAGSLVITYRNRYKG